MMRAILGMMLRDFRLYRAQRSECAKPWMIFIMIPTLFPMSMQLSPNELAELGPAILWIALVIAIVISQDSLLNADYSDGSLEHILLSQHSIPLLLLSKLIVYWIMIGIPILMITPILAVFLNLPTSGTMGIITLFCLGIPTLSIIAALGSALTIGLNQGSVLMALLVLPWMAPVLMIGAHGAKAAAASLPFLAEMLLLFALFLTLILLVPKVMAYALKVRIQ